MKLEQPSSPSISTWLFRISLCNSGVADDKVYKLKHHSVKGAVMRGFRSVGAVRSYRGAGLLDAYQWLQGFQIPKRNAPWRRTQ